VNELLTLKRGPDAALMELENQERDALLSVRFGEQSDLRKKDVIAAMSQLLEQELSVIHSYQDEKTESSRILLEDETKNNLLLNDVFQDYDKSRANIIEKINEDEEWQKSAVAALIAKSDARSWGLMEQIKIVESQIAAMTNYELDKKKISQGHLLDDVADKRVNLTFVLLDLMEQQDKRKRQLIDTLTCMENQKTEDDFWLMQYQKLLDSRSGAMQTASAGIDPLLGYNFLLNGVIHVVPFLLKIWQRKDFQLELVTDNALQDVGIKNPSDRKGVLKSINDFLSSGSYANDLPTKGSGGGKMQPEDEEECNPGPSSASAPQESFEDSSQSASPTHSANAVNAVECVICMDSNTQVIFLPCGKLMQIDC